MMPMPTARAFAQVNVFSEAGLDGNPVAVVLDAEGVDDEQMQRFARWTNLAETTFLLAPTSSAADYRLRIFTPVRELPFAGHPTLGSARAWLDLLDGVPRQPGVITQECAAGLIRIRDLGAGHLAFASPALVRTGPLDEATIGRILTALNLPRSAVITHQWVDNGPGWAALLLDSVGRTLAVTPRFDDPTLGCFGIAALHPAGSATALEVRAFCPDEIPSEDPVTGSLNAGFAEWLIGEGMLPPQYVASQGLHGRVHIHHDGDTIWVAGQTHTIISGQVAL